MKKIILAGILITGAFSIGVIYGRHTARFKDSRSYMIVQEAYYDGWHEGKAAQLAEDNTPENDGPQEVK